MTINFQVFYDNIKNKIKFNRFYLRTEKKRIPFFSGIIEKQRYFIINK